MARDLAGSRGDSGLAVPARANNEEFFVILDGFDPPGQSRVCTFCVHLRSGQGRTCDAFPRRDSIPLEIWLGENDHRQLYAGDHGIRFEAANVDVPAPVP